MSKPTSEHKYYTEFKNAGLRLGEHAQEYILSRFMTSYNNYSYLLEAGYDDAISKTPEECYIDFLNEQQPRLETMMFVSDPLSTPSIDSKRFNDDKAFEHYVAKSVRVWFQNQYLATDEGKVYDTFRHHLQRGNYCISKTEDEAAATGRKPTRNISSSSTGRSAWRHIDAPCADSNLSLDSLLARINNNPKYPIDPQPADPTKSHSRPRYAKNKQIPNWLEGALKIADGYVSTWRLARTYTNLDSVQRSGIIRKSREQAYIVDLGDQEAQSYLLENAAVSQFDDSMTSPEEKTLHRQLIEEFMAFFSSHTEMDPRTLALTFFREKHLDLDSLYSMFEDTRLRQNFADAINDYEKEYQEVQ